MAPLSAATTPAGMNLQVACQRRSMTAANAAATTSEMTVAGRHSAPCGSKRHQTVVTCQHNQNTAQVLVGGGLRPAKAQREKADTYCIPTCTPEGRSASFAAAPGGSATGWPARTRPAQRPSPGRPAGWAGCPWSGSPSGRPARAAPRTAASGRSRTWQAQPVAARLVSPSQAREALAASSTAGGPAARIGGALAQLKLCSGPAATLRRGPGSNRMGFGPVACRRRPAT